MMVRIMIEPKESIYAIREMLKTDGVELIIKPVVFEQIADIAMEYKVGARSLRGIFEELMTDVLYAIPDNPSIRRVVIENLFEPPRLLAETPARPGRTERMTGTDHVFQTENASGKRGLSLPLPPYWSSTLASLITFAHLAISALMRRRTAAACCYRLGRLLLSFWFTSGSLRMRAVSAESLSTMSCGVFAGATRPNQAPVCSPARRPRRWWEHPHRGRALRRAHAAAGACRPSPATCKASGCPASTDLAPIRSAITPHCLVGT